LPGGFPGVAYRHAAPALLPAPQWRRYAGGLLRALKTLRPDIVEVHNRPDIALFLADHLPRTPVCLFLHNDPHGMRAARTVSERAELLHRLARVATVSAWLRARLLEGLPDGRCDVLANCLDLASIPASPAARDKVILFAGRVVADKGADAFVQAAARALPRLPGWRAEIIGADRFSADSPDTAFLRALRPQAAAAGITLHGYRPHDDVLAAMSRAAIVVVPSRWPEPFGLTALEAMAAGAALLASQTGGLPEVTGAACVPVSAEDPAGMADAMVALATDPARRAALGAAGRARATQFDTAIAAATLAALRENVCSTWPHRLAAPI
jgi:glycosyltransferase involved in cell wall biosynthesis